VARVSGGGPSMQCGVDPLRSLTPSAAFVGLSAGLNLQRGRELRAQLQADRALPNPDLTIGIGGEGPALAQIGHAAWTCLDDAQPELACEVAGRDYDAVQVNHALGMFLDHAALHSWGLRCAGSKHAAPLLSSLLATGARQRPDQGFGPGKSRDYAMGAGVGSWGASAPPRLSALREP
jgi:hypothetical protein